MDGTVMLQIISPAPVNSNYSPYNNDNMKGNQIVVAGVVPPDPVILVGSFTSSESLARSEFYVPVSKIDLMTELVLFENERYSPFFGWSSKGLLPTDHKFISTEKGDVSWNSFDDAERMLLSHGWQFLDDSMWRVDSTGAKEDGWKYAVDFNSFKDDTSGNMNKGAAHFVRRRKSKRTMAFKALNLYGKAHNLTCDHCDLQEVYRLAQALLDSFIKISLTKYPSSFPSEKVLKVKNAVVEATKVMDQGMYQYSFDNVQNSLTESCKRVRKSSALAFSSSQSIAGDAARVSQAAEVFSLAERCCLARLIIRRFDTNYAYHCGQMNCGGACSFAVYKCSNVGCAEQVSAKWMTHHDAVCPFKIIPCTRNCGVFITRSTLDYHLFTDCILRPVFCTYSHVGCLSPIIFRDLQDHIQNSSHEHLRLAMETLDKVNAEKKMLDERIVQKDIELNSLRNQQFQRGRGRYGGGGGGFYGGGGDGGWGGDGGGGGGDGGGGGGDGGGGGGD
eukprot:gene17378-24007_t